MHGDIFEQIAFVSQREQALRLAVVPRNANSEYSEAMPSLPNKLEALRDTISAFAECGVVYALIGGVAVGVRSGVPRATLDVDFAVPTDTDFEQLASALKKRGFTLRGSFPHSFNLVHPSGEPVQLAFDIEFDPMLLRAESLQLDDIQVRVVTTKDLIEMKRRAASDPARRRSKALRDQADIALLEGDVPDPDEGW